MDYFITISSSVGSALIAAFLTGFFTLKAVKKTYKNQREQDEIIENQHIESLQQAIHDEMETIFERYQETMGARIDIMEEQEPLLFYYPLVSDFFSVYNQNTRLIGKIKKADLRKSIIKTYILAKGMVDSFRMNNELLHKYEVAEFIYLETQTEIYKQQAMQRYQSLVGYGQGIKDGHKALKEEVNKLLRELRKNGALHEN